MMSPAQGANSAPSPLAEPRREKREKERKGEGKREEGREGKWADRSGNEVGKGKGGEGSSGAGTIRHARGARAPPFWNRARHKGVLKGHHLKGVCARTQKIIDHRRIFTGFVINRLKLYSKLFSIILVRVTARSNKITIHFLAKFLCQAFQNHVCFLVSQYSLNSLSRARSNIQ